MEKTTKIIIGASIVHILAMVGFMIYARRHNGKPAYATPPISAPPDSLKK